MVSASRVRAKKQKKKLNTIGEREKAERLIYEKTARLRALRLAQEAKDKAEKTTD
jgi:hypothetical protein